LDQKKENIFLVYNVNYFTFEPFNQLLNHKHMKRGVFIFLVVFVLGETVAQTASKQAMDRLAFLEGQWVGKATAVVGPGESKELEQHESVERRLGGGLMVIEGKGFVEGAMEFNAFAIISFDGNSGEYKMQSWLATGETVPAYLRLGEGQSFEWGFDIPQGKVRYRLHIDDKGQWVEKGEFSPKGTNTWYPSLHMVLNRK
jgi:hypothetical protein